MADGRHIAGLIAGGWRSCAFAQFRDGIEICRLYEAGPGGPSAAFLRYAPGGTAPRHEHVGHETILVLDGEQADEKGSYGVGALVVNPPGSVHTVHSAGGCVVLIHWDLPVRFF